MNNFLATLAAAVIGLTLAAFGGMIICVANLIYGS